MIQHHIFSTLKSELDAAGVTLVAVSKTQSPEAILELYHLGQRVFGENRVQELLQKQALLPGDIQWHLIGHLQTNKVRQVIPSTSMIESVDSIRLLSTLQKEASLVGQVEDILLQVKISREASKYGFDPVTLVEELTASRVTEMSALRFRGVMGMASFVDDKTQIRNEFRCLKKIFDLLKDQVFSVYQSFDQISMGMSGDFRIAIEEGSTMVRIGSLIFGARN
ncbi:MAG TPA: YggS family pyridoxal phosphate-dependent enzyme [Saprospiraceae bacterium]|nr:YggS family pyridoxal phosphate-dependent enzyme [Saprospiraceae bacterium]